MSKKSAIIPALITMSAMDAATRQPKPASWLTVTLKRIRKRKASDNAINWEKVMNHITTIPLLELEGHKDKLRILMREATNPVDKAIYKRLFRKVGNVIEYRKACLK
jgi:hypothetical protein